MVMNSENPEQIVRRHYATDEHLRIRQETHARYTVPDRSFADWVLERVSWHGSETVLDVGCGTGLYYDKLIEQHPDVRYVGIDLVNVMLQGHTGYGDSATLMQSDAQQLPFAAASFDVVMANHMLYHVEDVEAAVT